MPLTFFPLFPCFPSWNEFQKETVRLIVRWVVFCLNGHMLHVRTKGLLLPTWLGLQDLWDSSPGKGKWNVFFSFLGRRDKDWIQSLESVPLQVGCSYFGRSGPDPYQAWNKGHVPGSCLRHHSVSCFWHSWTSEYIPFLICLDVYKNSLFFFFFAIYTQKRSFLSLLSCVCIWFMTHVWMAICFVVVESILCRYRYQIEEFHSGHLNILYPRKG